MAARAMWKAQLLIGEQQVPVKFYSAVEDRGIHFRLLHEKDQVPVQQQLVDAESGQVISWSDTLRAVATAEGDLVVLSKEELDELAPAASRDIEVFQFVPGPVVDHRWYDRPYYLGPDGSASAWSALAAALADTGLTGIARWVMRGKRYYGALTLHAGYPVLISLRSADSLVDVSELQAPAGRELDKKELAMARQLIGLMEGEFDPADYADEYRDRVLTLVETKRSGGKVARRRIRPKEESEDLGKALEASLKGARKRA